MRVYLRKEGSPLQGYVYVGIGPMRILTPRGELMAQTGDLVVDFGSGRMVFTPECARDLFGDYLVPESPLSIAEQMDRSTKPVEVVDVFVEEPPVGGVGERLQTSHLEGVDHGMTESQAVKAQHTEDLKPVGDQKLVGATVVTPVTVAHVQPPLAPKKPFKGY